MYSIIIISLFLEYRKRLFVLFILFHLIIIIPPPLQTSRAEPLPKYIYKYDIPDTRVGCLIHLIIATMYNQLDQIDH